MLCNISKKDKELAFAWATAGSPNSAVLFLATDKYGDCGENELIATLANLVYETNLSLGKHAADSFARHFVKHSFHPYMGSLTQGNFLDSLDEAAAISNEFFGVELIELNNIALNEFDDEFTEGDLIEGVLAQHIVSNPTANHIFLCKEESLKLCKELSIELALYTHIPFLFVEVKPPTIEQIYNYFTHLVKAAPSHAAENLLKESLERSVKNGSPQNYSIARELAAKLLLSNVNLNKSTSVREFLDEHTWSSAHTTKKIIGF